ncbi:response regulator transcription factor [Chloroflexus aggregans]|uniref:Two component transcriptional regulator, winged helix family n=1 Tax=Chloroflexus aggregans (strain MD-66 / DSM 9485) TaxID=326427 RepID=B8G7R1_CHLAD|nr:response regulator transcription factor [Chloroflexus aggregans]ACL24090.1 two component transcriptional regulator, winged helix family [Chloroflexus aggregans DSM 9485]
MQPTILVVDDEASIRNVAKAYLEHAGYRVLCATTGPEGLQMALDEEPDLIVLDLMLPGMDGMEITARLREKSDVFILMLTARSDEIDRVAGLRVGADDYLTKPFSPRELVARVEAILRRRRGKPVKSSVMRFTHVEIDPDAREARAAGQLLELTPTEFDLLIALARNHNRVLSREDLIEKVWGADFYGTDRVVDVYVSQVRRKIEALTGENLIRTARGVGYRFVDTPVSGTPNG